MCMFVKIRQNVKSAIMITIAKNKIKDYPYA